MTYDIDKVTPRPWEQRLDIIVGPPDSGDGWKDLSGTLRAYIAASPRGVTHAAIVEIAHIVHCVNHHEQLVSCLEWALDKAAEGMASPDPEYDRARALLDKVRY